MDEDEATRAIRAEFGTDESDWAGRYAWKREKDRGMFYIPELGLITRIHQDENGFLYVNLASHGDMKFYLGEDDKRGMNMTLDQFLEKCDGEGIDK